jgi:N-acetylglutamate synthase-like GNAT family acetyltransferase
MDIKLNPNLDLIDWKRVTKIFQLVEWGERKPEEVERAFRKGSVVCFVEEQDEIIAFGRTIDDGQYCALLVDIVVHPDYQKQGLGKTIVNKLVEQLKGYSFITLTAAPDKEAFYQKIGWQKQKSAYILPKNEKQRNEHGE